MDPKYVNEREPELDNGDSCDDADQECVVLMPLDRIRDLELPPCVSELSLAAAAVFAEALVEAEDWVGDAVGVSLQHSLILRNAYRVVGAIMARAEKVPVLDRNFTTREAALAYAALEDAPATFLRTPGEENRIGRIAWAVANRQASHA